MSLPPRGITVLGHECCCSCHSTPANHLLPCCFLDPKTAQHEQDILDRIAKTQDDTTEDLRRSQDKASTECARKDCDRALLALAAVRALTPVEGYGTNTSWAISDLCKAVMRLYREIGRLETERAATAKNIECHNELMDRIINLQNRDHRHDPWVQEDKASYDASSLAIEYRDRLYSDKGRALFDSFEQEGDINGNR